MEVSRNNMASNMNITFPKRTTYRIIFLLLLHFLVEFAQGNGPGDDRVYFETIEGLPPGNLVGVIPTRPGYIYNLDRINQYFELNRTSGEIINKQTLDRDSSMFSQDILNLFALGSKSQNPPHPVEILIKILDTNDNRPVFQEKTMNIMFAEGAKGAQHILVTATDIDLGENGTVSQYDIISGNHEGKFALSIPDVNSPFMYIEVIGDLDRELKDNYILNISARDNGIPPLYGFLAVNISVSDQNDNPPVFNPSEYTKKILENAKIGTSVIQVLASDMDSGLNKDIVFSLSDETGQFTIEPDTGIVRTLTAPLKCNRICGRSLSCIPFSCLLTVTAEDRGTPALSDRTYVSVSIVDTNDHSPVITFDYVPDSSKDFSSVDENTEPGKRVASISVQDADNGINSQTSIQITKGNELRHFKLFSIFTLNIIRVSGHLDRERISQYNLTIVATDKGIPPRSSTAFLIININDANDHAPVFDRPQYSISLPETSLPESFVASVKATDKDSGQNSDLVYSIVDGNTMNWFKIDSDTGLITIQAPLDHEITAQVNMNVSARDGGSQPFVSYAQVTVFILDENDEVPTFNQSVYHINMEENLASGIQVMVVQADDRDKGTNGSILYSFHPDVHSSYPNTFRLNQKSGEITTLKSFDREKVSQYNLKLIARDQGSPSLSSTCTINIRVLDINDHAPKFYPQIIYGNVQENRQSGTEVVRVAAVDPDEGENGRLTYVLVGNDFNSFVIDSGTGWIRTTRQLTRDVIQSYDLAVSATDGDGRTAQSNAQVKISVTAVDDIAPVFGNRLYEFQIAEDSDNSVAEIGRRVGLVSASTRSADGITYAIAGGDQFGIFAINDRTGEISTNKKLDREIQEIYDLNVLAIGGSKLRETTVRITVLDKNDNSPKFRSSAISTDVIENWPIGHNIFLAEAIDLDTGNNGKVTYRLQESSEYFGIRTQNGVIYLKKAISNIQQSRFDLKIIATDGGSPQKSSLMDLEIKIIDVNDHTPVFQRNHYEISVHESKPVNEIIFKLLATDADHGRNSEVYFKITRGNERNRFGIFPDGTLYVAHQLDREEQDLYMVTVVVCDRGENPRSSTANITINILDNNDSPPVFMNSTFELYVTENQPIGTFIGQVKAKDADSGINAELSYWADGQKNFTIDVPTGRIYTAKPFDRENVLKTTNSDFYSFFVYVRDSGKVNQKQDRALVKVHVLDENDNPPIFPRKYYSASVMENSKRTTNITVVTATDLDQGSNAVIRYLITDGNSANKFRIGEKSGQVTVNGALDREEKDLYRLVVTATDSGGLIQLSSSTTLAIKIEDANDNKPAPKFVTFQKNVKLSESMPLGHHVTTFSAIDADKGNNAVLFFNIVSGNNDNTFNIDAYSGRMYLTRILDHERKAQYDLEISVSDAGSPSLSQTHWFTIQVEDENDNSPVFADTSSTVTISEGKRVDSSLTIVRATDKDYNAGGKVFYTIAKQVPVGDNFRINEATGEIFIKKEIDREVTDTLQLTVMATDKAMPESLRKSSQKTITVIVTDINDHAPVFDCMNALVIPPGSSRGYKIGTISAKDPDSENNGKVSYDLVGGDTSLFSLQSSGELTLSQNLPGAAISYKITVEAKDDGGRDILGQKSTRMEITIIAEGTGNGPVFSNIQRGSVYENELTGKSITTVKATATQSGVNLEYYVTNIKANSVMQPRYFTVDKLNGVLKTTQVLDRESVPEIYDLEVMAIEVGGNSPKTRKTKVQVQLSDKNDSPPRFTSQYYSVSVPANQEAGKSFTRVSYDDPDTVGTAQVKMVDGGDSDRFRVDPQTGAISAKETFDQNRRSVYKFQVEASDGFQSSKTTVQVSVRDHSPEFDHPFYSFDVPEDSTVGTTIAGVAATDLDEGPGGHVTYELHSDWGKDKFRLDANLGTFTVIDRLDFEEIQLYSLIVIAKDGSIPPRSTSVTVYMNIKDNNDNAPVFDQSSYSEQVAENAIVGTTIIDVKAMDKDSGFNAEVRYSLIGGDDFDQFGIGPINGTVYTTAILDRETIGQYELLIIATDQPRVMTDSLSTTGTVVITLTDVNDSPPEFVTPGTISVKENSKPGSVIYTILANDQDEGDNAQINYRLTSGGPFTIEASTGNLRVTQNLDRETVSNYSVQVTASDQGTPRLSTKLNMVILVEDVNDHPPKFSSSQYLKTVDENIGIGTSLLKVFATDADEGLNGIVRYMIISGDDNYDFNMDMSSGVLRVQKALDYERVTSYTLTILAEDSSTTSTLNTTSKIIISVTDINDFEPVFVNSPYYAYVQENMNQLPVHVIQVSARDDDSGSNSRLIYDIRSEEEEQKIFSMNSKTGEITCNLMLDREQVQKYELIVVAFDGGHPRLTGSGTVTVYVKDINDHAPVFESNGSYTGHVTENLPPNTGVVAVQATDKDEGHNAQIVYSLEDDSGGKFSIIPESGQIITLERLDREVEDQYYLTVIASDHGIPPQSATSQVIVYIDDDNDNVPQFEHHNYTQMILDATEAGEFVLGVTAVDRDIGNNGKVTYRLEGQDAAMFNINTNTGVVTAAQRLSGNSITYIFSVRATDQGETTKSQKVIVHVKIQRVNNVIKPAFSPFPNNLDIDENTALGKFVTTIRATSPRTGKVTYHIAGGNIGRGFTINLKNGSITVAGALDYEITQSLNLWIEARDGGSPSVSSYKQLPIRINDINDNMPRFKQNFYNQNILENTRRGSMLVQIEAKDEDSGTNGHVMFALTGGNKNNTFRINSTTGIITTNNIIDREGIDLYHLVVEASDMGTPTRKTSTATIKVTVGDQNDNPPKFTHQFRTSIPEDISTNSFIIQITSTDKDLDLNAVANYELLSETNLFAIDRLSGNLTAIAKLDAEDRDIYSLKVRAVDESFSITTDVSLRVLDVNDNAPKISKNTMTFDLQEMQLPNFPVGQLSASDADISSPNNHFFYSLKRPSTLFDVDAETGTILALKTMIFIHSDDGPSTANRYQLDVVVTDVGTPPMSSEAQININVVDANNHAPIFDQDSYSSAVPENARVSDLIITVLAVDLKDFGINAEIEYHISGGNGTAYFRINQVTGDLTVAASLAGLKNRDFSIVVEARDKGHPVQSVAADISLHVTDVNNHSPGFIAGSFESSVLENVDEGSTIGTVRANDNDGGLNGKVQYFIEGGDSEELFTISKSLGIIKTAKKLDYETKNIYFLNITARDMGLLFRQTSRIFTVRVQDFNDNPPLFKEDILTGYVPENSPLNTEIFRAAAEDVDTEPNAVIHYSIADGSRDANMFDIVKETGIVLLKEAVDYERKTTYRINIMAFNPTGSSIESNLKSVVEVYIYVTSVNEFKPNFVKKEYKFNVSESAPFNTSIGSVLATDKDGGEDKIVYYFLIGASNMRGFGIDSTTGVVFVNGRPDYESSPQIVLNVLAKNRGSIKGDDIDECKVHVDIEDANDPPVFSKQLYRAYVAENSQKDVNVIRVNATDLDIQPENRQFTYTILDGNNGDWFWIDRVTGMIKTTGQGVLDRETTPSYNLTVGAVDSGRPPQTGSAAVKIELQDVNDNGPIFDPYKLVINFTETDSIGQEVVRLSKFTSDPDLSPNQGPYTYNAVLDSTNYMFEVRTSGLVQTKTALDRETLDHYVVPVEVIDNGQPKMSSTLTFTVSVADANDSPPEQRPLTILLNILDKSLAAGKVADIRPLDKDLIGAYSCQIESGSVQDFSIPSNCDLVSSANPDPKTHRLSVSGTDGANGEVTYDVSIQVAKFTNETLDAAIAVRLSSLNVEEFLTNSYSRFISSLKNLLGNQKTLTVFSLQELDSDLLVYMAVSEINGGYMSRNDLVSFLQSNINNLETATGAVVKDTSYSSCHDDMCKNGGNCQFNIWMGQNYKIHNSDHLILTSAIPEFKTFCECPASYTGQFCEIPMGPCGDTYCYNGGQCVTESGQQICHCSEGWDGPSCRQDKDECLLSPCQNGGTCKNLEGSFKCECVSGFHGKYCESSYYCASMPCQNGGTCQNLENGFSCDCVFGYFGNQCEKSSVGFEEGSFLEFRPIQDYTSVDLHVYFATVKENALILFNPVTVDQTDVGFLSLEIVSGVVRFSLKLGSDRPTQLEVNTRVSTGKWFRVDVQTSRDMAILKVVLCSEGAASCSQCEGQNPSCYDSKALNFGSTFVQGLLLNIGGIRKIEDILGYGKDILSHDFVGCMHSFNVNGQNVLDTELASSFKGVTSTCPRQSYDGLCQVKKCNNGGICVDEWSYTRCKCSDQHMGDYCEQEWQPFGFSPDAKVSFKLRESFWRDQQLQSVIGRKKRATDSSEIFIRLRTLEQNGALFYSSTIETSCLLWLENGKIRFVMTPPGAVNDPLNMEFPITDGKWHNITVVSIGNVFVIMVDGQRSEPKDFGSGYMFASLDVKEMALSGERVVPSGQRVLGFDGCISEFRVDNKKLPFEGKTDKYSIVVNGSVEAGCQALCTDNPCGDGNTCKVNGEAFVCMQTSNPSGGLDAGIIVVIVFFVILIIAILIVFILFRRRRSMFPCKGDSKGTKTNGVMGRDNADSTLRGMPIYGTRNEDLLQNQLVEELNYQKNPALSSRPDLIGSNYVGRPGSRPLMIDDGTVIIENGEMEHMNLGHDEMPEHYDLENASSIAPSDIDVIQHYKQYRSGEGHKFKPNPAHKSHHNSHRPRESPLNVNGRPSSALARDSPNIHKFQNNAHIRQSPVSITGSALSMPSRPNPHLNTNGVNRPSSAQAAYIHGPHVRNSPITQLNIRQNPTSHHNSSRSSLGSHHSHSTNSSAPRNNLNKPPRNGKPKHVKGLTVEEINRLNARPGPPSPASMLEAVSSSSDDVKRKHKMMKPVEHIEGNILLEPPDSSSDDSGANDSFTCSEFEYENDHRSKSEFDPGTMIFSKLTEVENETDDIPVQHRSNSDGMHSNCDSFTSTVMSSDEHFLPQKGPNGAFNIDSLLNWGPNFDKLVGVFKDIALLPDTETLPLEGGITTDQEEYV